MRFVRFNGVGVLGFIVQMAVLAALLDTGVNYLAATGIAVEAAVLNNFFWHERWTWRDRPAGGCARLARLWRFQVLNGVVSLAGNVLLVRVMTGTLGVPPIPANVVAIAACGLLNYFASDRIVFDAEVGG